MSNVKFEDVLALLGYASSTTYEFDGNTYKPVRVSTMRPGMVYVDPVANIDYPQVSTDLDDTMVVELEEVPKEVPKEVKIDNTAAWEAVYDHCRDLGMDIGTSWTGIDLVKDFITQLHREKGSLERLNGTWKETLRTLNQLVGNHPAATRESLVNRVKQLVRTAEAAQATIVTIAGTVYERFAACGCDNCHLSSHCMEVKCSGPGGKSYAWRRVEVPFEVSTNQHTVTFNGKEYEAVPGAGGPGSCSGCALDKTDAPCHVIPCRAYERKDREDVVFKAVDKP